MTHHTLTAQRKAARARLAAISRHDPTSEELPSLRRDIQFLRVEAEIEKLLETGLSLDEPQLERLTDLVLTLAGWSVER